MSQTERQALRQIEDRLRAQALELARGLLPDLENETLERAALWTGLEFLKDSVRQHLQRDELEIRHRQAELEQHSDFAKDIREVYAEAEQEKGRLLEHQGALKPLVLACQGHPRFAQLMRSGYGTRDYKVPFWRYSYHQDKQAARELCQRTGKKNFAQLREDYLSALESLGILQERLKNVAQAPLRSPRKEWQALEERRQGLVRLHLGTAHSRIQLALLRKGPIWHALARASLPPELRQQLEDTGLLLDQLEERRKLKLR